MYGRITSRSNSFSVFVDHAFYWLCVCLQGRTETVRPVSRDSVKFVKTMLDPSASPEDKLKALQKAAASHQEAYMNSMTGKGLDRHLFALYIVSKGMGVESPFLQAALSEPWRLSTSQQPQNQTGLWDPRYACIYATVGSFHF